MKASDHQHLIGKEKKEIIEELGFDFNYYHSEIWTYHIKTNWIGKKTFLLLRFKGDTVHQVKIKKSYAKIGY